MSTDNTTILDIGRVRAGLHGTLFSDLTYLRSTDSTNANLLARPPRHREVLLADEQTAGRGRLGRSWSSPRGGQLIASVSLIVAPTQLERMGTLPLAVGVALTDAIPEASLKWPNDLLIGGKKLAGILAEASPLDGGRYRVVIGFGINTDMDKSQLPVEHATSLRIEGIDVEPTELAVRVLRAVDKRLTQWLSADPDLRPDYRAVCETIGRRVRVETPSGDVFGVADRVDDDGRLVVDNVAYSAGDVTHLRLGEDGSVS